MQAGSIRSILKVALLWGLVGIVLAIFFLLVSLRTDVFSGLELVLWPSSFAFMALDNARSTRIDWIEGTLLLVLTNFVVYFVVGLILNLGWRSLSHKARRAG